MFEDQAVEDEDLGVGEFALVVGLDGPSSCWAIPLTVEGLIHSPNMARRACPTLRVERPKTEESIIKRSTGKRRHAKLLREQTGLKVRGREMHSSSSPSSVNRWRG